MQATQKEKHETPLCLTDVERARSTGLPSSIVVNDAHSGKSCVERFVCKHAQTCAPGQTHRGIKCRLSRRHALGSCKLSRRDIHEYDMAGICKCAQAIETATDTDAALLGVAWCQRVMATTSSCTANEPAAGTA